MKSTLEKRLADLETEYQAGRRMLEDLETKRANVQSSMLRIEGAIRVLSELLAQDDDARGQASPPEPAEHALS